VPEEFCLSEGLQVDVGEPDRDDLQWKLGSNTQANGQFVSSSVDWDEHKSYRWTLSYGGNGSGSYSVFEGKTKIASRKFKGGNGGLLHTGNALRLMVRAGAHTRAEDLISVSITTVSSSTVSQTLSTGSSGGASQQIAYFAGSSLSAGFSVEGTIQVEAKRHRRHHRQRLELEFLVNAGNVSCSQSAQTKVDLAYIQPDHLDTPRTVTDSTQKVIWQWDNQDPFGANAANEDPDGDGQRFSLNLRFPGQYFDSETGLHYNYFRDYDPSTGRYIQSDPIGLTGGLNTYAYVGGNPISYRDPFGFDRWGDDPYFGGSNWRGYWQYIPTTPNRREGVLQFVDPNGNVVQSWDARSGSSHFPPIPAGTWFAKREPFSVPSSIQNGAFCDDTGNCWEIPLTPSFRVKPKRSGFAVHPDGNVPGTRGRIGVDPSEDWRWFFQQHWDVPWYVY